MQETGVLQKPAGTTGFQVTKGFLRSKDQELRRSYSECWNAGTDEQHELSTGAAGSSSDVETVRCACCGVSEDCTAVYIRRIRAAYCGDWVCGLCAEAVSERMRRDQPAGAGDGGVEEALRSHMAVCREFNATTRLNPKLSLAGSMRDIARRSFNRRTTTSSATCHDQLRAAKTMMKTLSCQPNFFA